MKIFPSDENMGSRSSSVGALKIVSDNKSSKLRPFIDNYWTRHSWKCGLHALMIELTALFIDFVFYAPDSRVSTRVNGA